MRQVLSGHNGPVTCGAFTADGRGIVTGGGEGDAALRAWNPKTGECVGTIQGHTFHTEGEHCDCSTLLAPWHNEQQCC